MYTRTGCAVALASLVLVVVGLLAPSFTMSPSFGDPVIDGVLMELAPERMIPRTYSISWGILTLYEEGDFVLASILFLFSIVFPIGKVSVLIVLLSTWREETTATRVIVEDWCNWVLVRVSAYSMLDVFVIAVVAVGFKKFPLGTRIEPRWGIVVFAIAIVLSILAAFVFERLVERRKGRSRSGISTEARKVSIDSGCPTNGNIG